MRQRGFTKAVLTGLLVTAALSVTACEQSAGTAAAPAEPGLAAPSGREAVESGPPRQDGEARQNKEQAPEPQRKIVRTASLRLRVDRFDEATQRVRELATTSGGHIERESVGGQQGSLTLRVPSDRLDDVLNRFSEIGGVEHRDIQTQDVTEQAVDIEARLANQRASVERVRAMMEKTGDIASLVRVEEELTRRQADLDSLQRRQQALAGQVAMSTIQVTINARSSAPPVVQEGFVGGLASGWRALVDTVRVSLVVFGALLPFLLVIGIPLTALVVLLRRRDRARRRTAEPGGRAAAAPIAFAYPAPNAATPGATMPDTPASDSPVPSNPIPSGSGSDGSKTNTPESNTPASDDSGAEVPRSDGPTTEGDATGEETGRQG